MEIEHRGFQSALPRGVLAAFPGLALEEQEAVVHGVVDDPLLARRLGRQMITRNVITEHDGVMVCHLQPVIVSSSTDQELLIHDAAGRVDEFVKKELGFCDLSFPAGVTLFFRPVLVFADFEVHDAVARNLNLVSASPLQTLLTLARNRKREDMIIASGAPGSCAEVQGESGGASIFLARAYDMLMAAPRFPNRQLPYSYLYINSNPDGLLPGE